MPFASIDTGAKGALCAFSGDMKILELIDMPTRKHKHTTKSGLSVVNTCEIIRFLNRHSVTKVIVEWVWAQKHDTSTTAFSQGAAYCAVLDACMECGVDVVLIKPKDWQKPVACNGDKFRTYDKVRAVYPEVELHGSRGGLKDGRSDSIMIGLSAKKQKLV